MLKAERPRSELSTSGRTHWRPAASYLRVSTREQAERDGREEGFSIPAQRDAIRRKADELGAVVVEEFVDAGQSARRADRPELQRLLHYVQTHRVAYCIVHKIDRLARNRADDVFIHQTLIEAGVTLVSVTEGISETPAGMLVHGIMSTVAEFYSRNLAAEVIKGMDQKAAIGGTISRAPIGYLNVRQLDEQGRELKTVILDPDRAPLVKWAFETYAAGNCTQTQLCDELADRGLTTLPGRARAATRISASTVSRMLANPYYKGDIVYRGVTYPGRHEPLVSSKLWHQVQSMLAARKTAGTATQSHGHYLKGTVFCGGCGSRLLVTHAKNRHGVTYPYFVCSGRHAKRTDCTRPAILIETHRGHGRRPIPAASTHVRYPCGSGADAGMADRPIPDHPDNSGT